MPNSTAMSAHICIATRWGTTHTLGDPVVPLVKDSRNGVVSAGGATAAVPPRDTTPS
jgi:hypothetical protein